MTIPTTELGYEYHHSRGTMPGFWRLTRSARIPGFWRLIRYLAAGGGSLALDVGLQWVLLALAGLPVWLGATLSYEAGLLAHFVVNHRWVFGHRHHSWRRLAEFHAAALTAEVITLGVTNVLVYGPPASSFAVGLGPYAAKIAGTAAAFLWTFLTSFWWIWRPRREVEARAPASEGRP